ncbi:MAG: tetraacyldisaccharide 4'-kinase, partial [Pirellula sp.]
MKRIEPILDGTNRSPLAMVARAGLWVASQPYGMVIAFRNWLFDRGFRTVETASVPVISIGNLTAGGTGKTPASVLIARWFRTREVRVAILSRGYGALQDGVNDEAKELEVLLPDVPHLQSPDRVATSKIAVEELEMQLLILDDGFQHRKLHRDLNIVLVDATEPFGFGYLLPRGLLREPIASLRRADVVIATRADLVEPQKLAEIRTRIQRFNPRAAWIEAEHSAREWVNADGDGCDLEAFRDKTVVAISGIGNPKGFESTLRKNNVHVLEHMIFPDHHPFSQVDIASIAERISAMDPVPDAIVCTGKDLAKLGACRIAGRELWALRVEMQVRTGEDILG